MSPTLVRDGDVLHMKGDFVFDSIVPVVALWQQIKLDYPPKIPLIINCSAVTKADSSFFALLIEMRRWADHQEIKWQLRNLPKSLEGFLSAYGIGKLLASE